MTHHTLSPIAGYTMLSLTIMLLCSACGQFGDEGKEFEGYWVGDAKSETTTDGDIERANINYAVVEIVSTDDTLIIFFENFLNAAITCIVEAEIDGDNKFEIDRTSCYSSDELEIEIKGKGELNGQDSLSIELDVKQTEKEVINFVQEGKAEFDLELF